MEMTLKPVLIGALLGVLSGLGIGGGSLLMLYLVLLEGMSPENARMINLLFFLPSALCSCLLHWKQNRLPVKKVLPAMIAGSIFAAISGFVSPMISTQWLKRLFGILLMLTGLREIFYRPKGLSASGN